jgi:membrane-associated phospholipid phosphatase/pimeloyl-ACP methyl ester carboxylesterase
MLSFLYDDFSRCSENVSGWPSWDQALLEAVNLGLHHPFLTEAMLFITEKTHWYPFLGAGAVFLLIAGRNLPRRTGNVFRRRNPRAVVLGLVLCVAISDPAAYRIKKAVGRIRPCRDEPVAAVLHCPLDTPGRLSFPSNHAANSASMAVFIALCYPPLAVPAAFIVALIGFSRVYLAAHYPLDVLAGWAVGGIAGLVVFLLLRRPLRSIGIIGFANRFRFRQKIREEHPGPGWEKLAWASLDGHPVEGWHLPGGPGLLVFIHGLGGNMTSRATLAGELRRRYRWGALLVPLRGDDGHPIRVTSGGILEPLDVLGALAGAAGMGYRPEEVILYGVSMGGSAALKAAALAGDLAPGILVVHGGFRRFFTAAVMKLGRIRTRLLRRAMPGPVVRDLESFDAAVYAGLCPCRTRMVYISAEMDNTCDSSHGEEIMSRRPGSEVWVLSGEKHPDHTNARSRELLAAFRDIRAMQSECPAAGNGATE